MPIVRFITTVRFASHTRITGMPAIGEFGSSKAALLTVSLAPITSTRSASLKSSLISSSSSTMSYGTPASASSTFSCPGMRPATGWMAKRTFTPLSISVFAMSATAYCALATARPYPGTMMMSFACVICPTTSSRVTSVCVPVISIAGPLAASPHPPRITFGRLRFIALHMM